MSRARVLLLNAALGRREYRVPDTMSVKAGFLGVATRRPRQRLCGAL